MLNAGIAHITAIEPSEAYNVLCKNFANNPKITFLNEPGDKIPASGNFDYVFSFGVIHHIPDPDPVMKASYAALKSGGKIGLWLYGREGNGLYLAFARTLRVFTTKLPHNALVKIANILEVVVRAYASITKIIPLPLKSYLENYFMKMSKEKRRLIIYDQLNPAYAKYYRGNEARDLLERAGFVDVKLYHRYGYSWTVVGTKK